MIPFGNTDRDLLEFKSQKCAGQKKLELSEERIDSPQNFERKKEQPNRYVFYSIARIKMKKTIGVMSGN